MTIAAPFAPALERLEHSLVTDDPLQHRPQSLAEQLDEQRCPFPAAVGILVAAALALPLWLLLLAAI